MPRPKSVESLEHFCLKSIADNLDKFASHHHPRRGISSSSGDDSNNTEDELSCFDCLPSQLVVSILDAVKINRHLNKDKNLLALLVTTRLDTLNLRHCSTPSRGYFTNMLDDEMLAHLLLTAALRHSPLKSLSMPCRTGIPCCLIFKDLLPAFPNLKKLDVSYSSHETINDDFMALLAISCLKLEELRMLRCSSVTDVGIEHLCGSHDAGTGGADRGCKSLVQLSIDETRVTQHGARLALEHLPRLQIFDYPTTLQIAAEMHRTNGTRRPLNLVNLNATLSWGQRKMPYMKGTLIGALRLCPFVIDVNISDIPRLVDEDLTSLLKLKCLKKLTLKDCQGISFDGGLLPILKKFGPSSLESLTLRGVREVNVGSIVEFCSELREIRLNRIQRFSPARPGLRPSPRNLLPHLRHLTMGGYVHDVDQPSHADVSLLLCSAPALERIELQSLRHLRNGILEEAIAHHGFPHLKHFQLERCPKVTKGVVDRFLELENPLSLISIEKNKWIAMCESPNPHGCHDPAWKEEILKKNLDLKIRYCECY